MKLVSVEAASATDRKLYDLLGELRVAAKDMERYLSKEDKTLALACKKPFLALLKDVQKAVQSLK